MGVLTVLGLQLGLIAFSLGTKARPEWSIPETVVLNEEPSSSSLLINFETGYEAPDHTDDPELGLETTHQDPQDYDITLMTHRVRRSEKTKKKKKPRKGAYSLLSSQSIPSLDGKKTPASSRTKREEPGAENLLSRPNPHQGKNSVIGNAGEPEVVRAKRHVENGRIRPKEFQGRYSMIGRGVPPPPNPTRSNNQ